MVNRFDVYLVNLDPEPSSDPKLTRPCVVVSPNELNRHLKSAIIAPISSAGPEYPTRVAVEFLNGHRAIILDQVRAVDQRRLVKKIGEIDQAARSLIIDKLQELFAE
jgi:mRNA interferase MazF